MSSLIYFLTILLFVRKNKNKIVFVICTEFRQLEKQ